MASGDYLPVRIGRANLMWFTGAREINVVVPHLNGFTLMGMKLLSQTRLEIDRSQDLVRLTYTGQGLFSKSSEPK